MITVEIDLEIFDEASKWEAEGTGMALAIVLKTWGSSPRQPGSMMLIREDGHLVGSVSGGCIESEVIEKGLKVIEGGNPTVLKFGVSDQTAWKSGLTCGGKIYVLIESFNKSFL